jgi:hypothetical protein
MPAGGGALGISARWPGTSDAQNIGVKQRKGGRGGGRWRNAVTASIAQSRGKASGVAAASSCGRGGLSAA